MNGIAALAHLLARRVDLDTVFADEDARRHAIMQSGGSIRDLLRIVSQAADFVLAGVSPTMQMCMTLDATQLQTSPGTLTSSDGESRGAVAVFDHLPALVPALLNDPQQASLPVKKEAKPAKAKKTTPAKTAPANPANTPASVPANPHGEDRK